MPYSDFVMCWAYEVMEPFGEKGDYLRAGALASLTANIHRDTKKHREPFAPEDFFPSVEYAAIQEAKQHQRIDLMMQAFAASNPGTIRMKPKKVPRA